MSTDITGGAGTYGRIEASDAKQAIESGIFYGTGYEGAKALNDDVTREDFAALQKYAHKSAIVSLGLDPNKLVLDGDTNDKIAWQYTREEGLVSELQGVTDVVHADRYTKAEYGEEGFNSRVAAHEYAHRGLDQIVNAVYGKDRWLGGDTVAWGDASKLTRKQQTAVARLRDILEDTDSNRAENEYLTRLVEQDITGNKTVMYPVTDPAYDTGGEYGKMDEAALKDMTELWSTLEGVAQKLVAQRRRGGPR